MCNGLVSQKYASHAVFTYEKGPAVVGIFLAFAVAMHLAELSRSKAAAKTSSSFT